MPVWQSRPLTWQEEGMWSQALLSAAGAGSPGAESGLRMDATSRQSLLGDMGHCRLLGPPRIPPTSFLLDTVLFLLGQPPGLCWNPLWSPQFFSFPLILGKNSPSLPCFLLAHLPLSSESFTKDLKPPQPWATSGANGNLLRFTLGQGGLVFQVLSGGRKIVVFHHSNVEKKFKKSTRALYIYIYIYIWIGTHKW